MSKESLFSFLQLGAPIAGGLNVISRFEWKRITPTIVPST